MTLSLLVVLVLLYCTSGRPGEVQRYSPALLTSLRAGLSRVRVPGLAGPQRTRGPIVESAMMEPPATGVPGRASTQLLANKLPSTAGLMPKEDYCKQFGTTLVIGGGRGLGLALSTLLSSNGCKVYATVRRSTEELSSLGLAGVVEDIDMLDYAAPQKLAKALRGVQLDTVLHVSGYFTTEGPLTDLNRAEEVKMFEICAIAPVFVTAELLKGGNLRQGARIGFITSEGGSIGLRTEKEGGANYGHHMSKAASNMAGRLMAWDLKPHGVSMVMIHPGFLRTEMTSDKYAHLYEELGAVTAAEAAPFILQPVADLTPDTTGRFVAALGSQGLGLGVWALPMKVEYPADIPPGGELPF